jgi:hypothetical protein
MISFRYFVLGIPYNREDCESYSRRVGKAKEIIVTKRCSSYVFGDSINVELVIDLTWVFDKFSVKYPVTLASLRHPFFQQEREQAEGRAELRLEDLIKRLADFSTKINSSGDFKEKAWGGVRV